MKIINNLKYFISNISFTQPKVLLGRWTVDYCENKINRKSIMIYFNIDT